jgi:hypothetical protein
LFSVVTDQAYFYRGDLAIDALRSIETDVVFS